MGGARTLSTTRWLGPAASVAPGPSRAERFCRHDGTEEPVPDGEVDAEVAVGGARVGVRVMPRVDLGAVDEIAQRPDAQAQVRVVAVPDRGADDGEREEHFAAKPEHREGNVEQAVVDQRFGEVKAHAPEPIHARDGVVNLVNLPEPRHAMEEVVPMEPSLLRARTQRVRGGPRGADRRRRGVCPERQARGSAALWGDRAALRSPASWASTLKRRSCW